MKYTAKQRRTAVHEWMDAHVKVERLGATRYPFRTIEGFVKRNGKEWTKRGPMPKSVNYQPRSRQCYLNAYKLWTRFRQRTHYIYCEGIVFADEFIIPVLHGWVVDTQTNVVLDPSITAGHRAYYYGVQFQRSYTAWAWMLLKRDNAIGILGNLYMYDDLRAELHNGLVAPHPKEDHDQSQAA